MQPKVVLSNVVATSHRQPFLAMFVVAGVEVMCGLMVSVGQGKMNSHSGESLIEQPGVAHATY